MIAGFNNMRNFIRLTGLRREHILSGRTFSGYQDEHNGKPYRKIADAYAGKSVFMTGGSGFLGKVLIERLLYNCKDIKNIYILIRPKKNMTHEQRLDKMFSLPIYMKLKELREKDLGKVIPINGDLLQPNLGLNEADQKLLEENANIVFHLGASVLFKDSFKNLMEVNCEGSRKIMNLCKKMKNLETFVYFSTAFAHYYQRHLDEVFYPKRVNDNDINECLRTGDDNKLINITKAPLYIVSKNICETIVRTERGDLPTIMIRPSAVTATYKAPIPGWLDTWISTPVLVTEYSRGLVSVVNSHKDVVLDVIPCDYVCNLAIVAAARGNSSKDISVYNCCTSSTNPVTIQEACDVFLEETKKSGQWELPPKKIVFTSSDAVVAVLTTIRDVIPAFLGDVYLKIKGEQPRYMKLYKRASFVRDSIVSTTMNSLFFKSERAQALAATLDEEDKERFFFDTNTINWTEYLPILHKGIFTHMLKRNK